MQTNKPKNQTSVFSPTRSTIREKEEEKTPSRSPITGFSADMDTGRMTRFAGDGQGNLISSTTYNGIPEQVFQQYGDLVRQGQVQQQKQIADAKKQREISDAALGSALVYAKQNKGFIPPSMTEALSAQLGIPIVGGNYTNDGQFVIYGRKQLQSANGMVRGERIEPIAVATPEMQYGILKKTGLGQSLQQEIYDSLSRRFTQQQLKDRGITDPSALSQKDAIALADAQMKERKGMFDMRTSQINSLMAQRKALVDEGAPGSEETIAAIDKKIAMLNEMNGAATGVNEFARALGVTGVGIGGGNPITKEGYEIVSEFEIEGGRTLDGFTEVVSNGKKVRQVQYLPQSGEYLVNTEEAQPDGSYSFRVSKGKQHLGSEYVTFVGEDGRVRQRKRMDGEGATEQHDDGLYLNVTKEDGTSVSVFVPKGKVIKTPFGNKRVSGEKGNYQLVDSSLPPNWSANEAIAANAEKRAGDDKKRKEKEQEEKERKRNVKHGVAAYEKGVRAAAPFSSLAPLAAKLFPPSEEDAEALGRKVRKPKTEAERREEQKNAEIKQRKEEFDKRRKAFEWLMGSGDVEQISSQRSLSENFGRDEKQRIRERFDGLLARGDENSAKKFAADALGLGWAVEDYAQLRTYFEDKLKPGELEPVLNDK